MTQTNVKVNEILDNPLFRNVAHLIGTIFIGYILLRLLLYILDVTQIGLGWLETHRDSGLLIIILILVLLLLLIDAGISLGRRRFGDEKYSVVESGISRVRPGMKRLFELSGKVKEKKDKGMPPAPAPTGVSGGFLRKEPVSRKAPLKTPEAIPGRTSEQKVPDKSDVKEPVPTPKPTRYEVGKFSTLDEIMSELQPGVEPSPEPKPAHGFEKPLDISEKPTSLEDTIKKPAPYKEPKSNIKFFESVPILVKNGKRVIKAFDSEHSINVIDFRSKITQKDVKITIELLKEHSVMAEPISEGLVYEFDNIGLNVPSEAVDEVVIRFKVGREWVTDNKIRAVELEQFINGGWDIVTSKRIGQDARYLFYEANVFSLSMPFAIVGI